MSAQNQNALIVARGQVEQYKFELQKNRIMVRSYKGYKGTIISWGLTFETDQSLIKILLLSASLKPVFILPKV